MVVFDKPHALADMPLHYCPGCTHGIIHRLVAEVMDELGIEGKTIGIAPVGCSVMAYNYFNCDMIEAAHGRAPAIATGVKRANPENVVFTYQGDGDLASIGMAETVHAAARNENITVIFVNNVKQIRNAKKAIKKAFQNQIDGKGFSLIEVLSTCPTNWGMTPQAALKWIDDKMIPYYPLGVYKDRTAATEQKEEN